MDTSIRSSDIFEFCSGCILTTPGSVSAWRPASIRRIKTTEAIDEFERLLDQDPNDDYTHRRLAQAFVAKNESKRAAHHLQEALRLNPEDAEAKHLLDRIPTSDQAVLP